MIPLTDILPILACPKCHASLTLTGPTEKPEGLCCQACALVYPIEDDIPVLLIHEAVPLADWQNGKRTLAH